MTYFGGAALSDVYRTARSEGYGFFASNVTHLDILVGLLRGAENAESDAIVQLSQETAAFYGDGDAHVGLDAFCAYLERFADSLDVGVSCNVDHVHLPDQRDFLETVTNGIASSVMVDASDKAFEENVSATREAVEHVNHEAPEMLVEAELGRVAGTEGGIETTPSEAFYTDPDRAVEFVDATGVDLLAVSVGTQHGVASDRDLAVRPTVAHAVDEALRDAGHDIPLVVHGASGLSPEQINAFVDAGVVKFNKNTRYQYEYARTAADFYHEHSDAIRPPGGVADTRSSMFSGADWSPEKRYFHPHVVGEDIRGRLADVMTELTHMTGSAGQTLR